MDYGYSCGGYGGSCGGCGYGGFALLIVLFILQSSSELAVGVAHFFDC